VNLIQMSFYVGQGTSGKMAYEIDNSYIMDMIKLYPNRFIGTAIVDPLGDAPDRAMAAIRPRGIRAFRIQPRYGKLPPAKWLEPAGYDAMFAEAARTGAVLSCLIDPDGLPEVDRMCRKYPDAPAIIDHLCRIGVNGTIRDDDVEALCAMANHPKVLVKVGAFYALGKKTPPYTGLVPLIRKVLQAFGAKRCMWESDCPFQVVQHKYDESIALIRDHMPELSAEDREWLLGKTAERWLFA
jgi:predicted TIM-barrel fold metal-dependent hydrolase